MTIRTCIYIKSHAMKAYWLYIEQERAGTTPPVERISGSYQCSTALAREGILGGDVLDVDVTGTGRL